MRIFVDVSGSRNLSRSSGTQILLDFLSRYAEGYIVEFDEQIRTKANFGPSEPAMVKTVGGGTNPDCLGPVHLGSGSDLKLLLSDRLHPPITVETKNLIELNPDEIDDPKTVALSLSLLDDALRKASVNREGTKTHWSVQTQE